jgi:hypothetical protein
MTSRRRDLAIGVALGVLAARPAWAQPAAALANLGGYPVASSLAAPVFSNPGDALPVPPPPFQATIAGGLQEGWTDNVYLVGAGADLQGRKNTDTITALVPSVVAVTATRRVSFTANYTANIDWYRENPGLDGVNHNGVAATTLELLDKELYFDGRALISEQAVNPSAASAVTTRSLGTNRNQSTVYQAGPRWQEGLAEDIVLQVTASRGETWNQTSGNALSAGQATLPATPSNLTNITTDQGRVEIRQLPVGTPLQWILSSESSESHQGGTLLADVVDQFASELRVDDDWSILATTGEEHLRGSGLSSSLSGPFFNAGLHWRPSPNLEVRVTDGHRADAADLNALIDWRIGPRTVLRATQSVRVTDDQQKLFSSLNNLQHDDQGNFVDPFSGLPTTALGSTYQLSNSVYRLESSAVALSHSDLTDSLSLTAELDRRTILGTAAVAGQQTTTALEDNSGNSTNAVVALRWSHRLTRDASVSMSMGDTEVLSASAGQTKAKTYSIAADWFYSVSPTGQLQVSYRLSETLQPGIAGSGPAVQTVAFGRVKEDYVLIGVKKSF